MTQALALTPSSLRGNGSPDTGSACRSTPEDPSSKVLVGIFSMSFFLSKPADSSVTLLGSDSVDSAETESSPVQPTPSTLVCVLDLDASSLSASTIPPTPTTSLVVSGEATSGAPLAASAVWWFILVVLLCAPAAAMKSPAVLT